MRARKLPQVETCEENEENVQENVQENEAEIEDEPPPPLEEVRNMTEKIDLEIKNLQQGDIVIKRGDQ